MKKYFLIDYRIAFLGIGLALLGNLQAQRIDWKQYGQAKEGFYVGLSLRPSSADANINSTVTPALNGIRELSVDPGFGFSIPAGYSFGNGFRAEVEPNFIYHSFDAAEGVTSITGDMINLLMMGNVFYEYANETKITPYIGLGLGPAISTVSITDVDGTNTSLEMDDFGLAWQVMPGVSYQLTPQLSLGVGYRYLGMSKMSDADLTLQDITIHAIDFQVRWVF